MNIEIIYVDSGGDGYHPISYMVGLAAELLEANLILVRHRPFTIFEKISGLLPRSEGEAAGILVCRQPAELATVLLIPNWRTRYRHLVAWVFDSFWPEYTPGFVRYSSIFDRIFVTELEDMITWQKMLGARIDWLPWGSDALRLGSSGPSRSFDLVRLGRQPTDWENDEETARLCTELNLRFQGRPPRHNDASDGQQTLMRMLAQTKFTISFSNLASPGPQTHPTRAYITARWTDALSAGATVAGIPPRGASVKELLWDEALLDLGTVDRPRGLQVLRDAAEQWTPRRALWNHFQSLQVLDWRWRFKKIATRLGARPQKLDDELALLCNAISNCCHNLALDTDAFMGRYTGDV